MLCKTRKLKKFIDNMEHAYQICLWKATRMTRFCSCSLNGGTEPFAVLHSFHWAHWKCLGPNPCTQVCTMHALTLMLWSSIIWMCRRKHILSNLFHWRVLVSFLLVSQILNVSVWYLKMLPLDDLSTCANFKSWVWLNLPLVTLITMTLSSWNVCALIEKYAARM